MATRQEIWNSVNVHMLYEKRILNEFPEVYDALISCILEWVYTILNADPVPLTRDIQKGIKEILSSNPSNMSITVYSLTALNLMYCIVFKSAYKKHLPYITQLPETISLTPLIKGVIDRYNKDCEDNR